jgi:hypothetical protein
MLKIAVHAAVIAEKLFTNPVDLLDDRVFDHDSKPTGTVILRASPNAVRISRLRRDPHPLTP